MLQVHSVLWAPSLGLRNHHLHIRRVCMLQSRRRVQAIDMSAVRKFSLFYGQKPSTVILEPRMRRPATTDSSQGQKGARAEGPLCRRQFVW